MGALCFYKISVLFRTFYHGSPEFFFFGWGGVGGGGWQRVGVAALMLSNPVGWGGGKFRKS